jgi:hypothetical protein
LSLIALWEIIDGINVEQRAEGIRDLALTR